MIIHNYRQVGSTEPFSRFRIHGVTVYRAVIGMDNLQSVSGQDSIIECIKLITRSFHSFVASERLAS
jgi:hypothetical protein